MVQRTVLKVDISCQKCKKKLLKAVSGLQGVDKIEVDAAKGTLTVTGDADPLEIIVRTRRTGKSAEVVSVGPPPPPPKQDAAKKSEQKTQEAPIVQTCYVYEQMGAHIGPYDTHASCSIM